MSSVALVVTLLVLAGTAVWVHLGPERWQPVVGPAVAAFLLAVGAWSGMTWAQLGLDPDALVRGLLLGGAAAALVGSAYAVAVRVPATRRLFLDARHRVGPARAARRALLVVPLGVVVLEEVAFRGVLWGLLEMEYGTAWATAATSVLFGLWHVLPAIDGARANASEGAPLRPGILVGQVLGTVAFTTLAGVVFALLRDWSGSLVAPFLLHWAVNGLGVLAAAWAWSVHRD